MAAIVAVALATDSVPSTGEIRDFGEDLGPAGPLVFIPLSALLSSVFFPGPALAGTAGSCSGSPSACLSRSPGRSPPPASS